MNVRDYPVLRKINSKLLDPFEVAPPALASYRVVLLR